MKPVAPRPPLTSARLTAAKPTQPTTADAPKAAAVPMAAQDGMEAARQAQEPPKGAAAAVSAEQLAPSQRGSAGALFRVQYSGKQGPDGTPRPEVSALLKLYGAPRMGRPRERLLTWAAKIQALVGQGGSPKAIAGRMMDNDIRRQVFLLEGGLKFYKKRYPQLDGQKRVAKSLEDHLGWVSGARDMHALAVEKRAPSAVVAVLKRHVEEKEAALEALVAQQWSPDEDGQVPAIRDLLQTLSETPWDDYQTDKAYCRKELRRRLGKIQEMSELSPSEGGYDMKQLQGDTGLHELRRNLRWMPIYAEALDGAVQLDAKRNPSKHYKKALGTALADSKYVRLPDADHELDPIAISKSLYVANMQLVRDFGALKDGGEAIEELALAYQAAAKEDPHSGLPQDFVGARLAAEQLLGLDPAAYKDVQERGQAIYDAMRDHKLIKKLRKDLKA